jgi:peptide/nickel transport system substrate-binding protein
LGILVEKDFVGGDFDFCVWGLGHGDADLLWVMFHSSQAGAPCCNMGRIQDPELDQVLDETRTATTPEQREAALHEVQRIIVEQAYVVPLYQGMTYYVVNERVNNVIMSKYGDARFRLQWFDAYIDK